MPLPKSQRQIGPALDQGWVALESMICSLIVDPFWLGVVRVGVSCGIWGGGGPGFGVLFKKYMMDKKYVCLRGK